MKSTSKMELEETPGQRAFRMLFLGIMIGMPLGILAGFALSDQSGFGSKDTEIQSTGETMSIRSPSESEDETDKSSGLIYATPAADEFSDYLYNENGHQNINLYGYFSQYAKIDAEVGMGYKNGDYRMYLVKPDRAACSIFQSHLFPPECTADIIIHSPDDHTNWCAPALETVDEPVIDDCRMGITLTKAEFYALVDWVKLNGDYPADYCPFAGRQITHNLSTTIYDSKTNSVIKYGYVAHDD